MTLASCLIGDLCLLFVSKRMRGCVCVCVCAERMCSLFFLVGRPIDPPSALDDDQAVKRLHDQYMGGLQALWDKYKDELAPDCVKELSFI